ncbi:hypothetical protein PCANC_13657 [Puccinia coronata f. sp. avenae]|uniref:Uncharacterized protein n=1 Tax=Puccinia coronata f. sp. avenae TaxID=200324 RepID=A0A2N5UKV8_9BASI|nr:hypothetical protein PCANC_13657 [Puccinia coronata f. sp. avenae]PLW47906.1 hypothetical protein PCASD_04962 [Puccinia coronata f. sp. avenae]
MAVCKLFYIFLSITLMARICLSEPAPECFDGDTVVAEDCKKAAQLLSYNTDGKFKPELKEEKPLGLVPCQLIEWKAAELSPRIWSMQR